MLADARELSRARDGLAPLLLLDEIAAHLDAMRRAALFEEIAVSSAQAWMTGTDLSLFENARAQIFEVRDGVLPRGGRMIPLHNFLFYCRLYAVAIAMPGPGIFSIVARALGQGFRKTVPAVMGIMVGDLILMTLVGLRPGVVAQGDGHDCS